ncbi:MAG TPA: hypothetical protein VFQ00_04470 [Terriglobales bacterium]|nr:hypothetical protein [Terriglobales bacterium]
MNGLAVGTPGAGLTATDLGNGALYFSEVRMTVNTILGQGYVTASFSTPFQHPAALAAWICPSNSSCNVAANYSALSTSGGVTNIVPPPGVNSGTTVTIGIAIFVPDNDGASAVTGNDNGGTITFTVVNAGLPIESDTLKLATSPNKIQSAVELTLDSDPSGLTINPATDYSVDYGNVNGLGIGAGAGLTAIAQAGGAIYSTPYRIKPAFSDLRSTTGTITVCTQTAFAHSAILNMQDASASAGPFTAIPNCGARVQITNTASDRSTITRYLGLFISKVNGPGTSFASDSAVLTYTITVP